MTRDNRHMLLTAALAFLPRRAARAAARRLGLQELLEAYGFTEDGARRIHLDVEKLLLEVKLRPGS